MKKYLETNPNFNTKKIINMQHVLGDVRFGLFGSASKNACGVVSIHNLKSLLGIETNFVLDYKRASRYGSNFSFGIFGTNPLYMNHKIKQIVKNKKMYVLPKLNDLKHIFAHHDIIILAYAWGGKMDLHYATFKRNQDHSIQGFNSSQQGHYHNVNKLITSEPIKRLYFAWGINSH